MATSTDVQQNRLLAALPEAVLQRWLPQLEWVELPRGQALHHPGACLSHAWFPTTAIVSLQNVTQNGNPTEIAVVGNEGIVGIPLFMGNDSTPTRAVVHSAGTALRIKAQTIKDEFDQAGLAMPLLLRYGQALITQIAQIAVCNRHHSLMQQLCRRLLMNLDRLQGSEFEATHELIAHLLGVRREGVTESAAKLQKLGLIRYTRGHVCVLRREGLEELACECYGVVKSEYERLLPMPDEAGPCVRQRTENFAPGG